MAIPFSRTLASLSSDSPKQNIVLMGLGCILLLAWFLWFFLVPLPVFSVSSSARLEVNADIQPIHAPAQSRIAAIHMTLGEDVEKGDVLISLDTERLQLKLNENQAKLAALRLEQKALQEQIDAIASGAHFISDESLANLAAAQARVEEADAQTRLAEERLQRLTTLQKRGNVSELELIQARSQLSQRQSVAEGLRKELIRTDKSQNVHKTDRQVQLQGLYLDKAQLSGEKAGLESSLAELHYDIAHQEIRASFSGKIGEIDDLFIGMHVKKGDRLAAIVPKGELKVDARFSPSEALGRIKKGQTGRIVFDGFPWAQYGSGEVTVDNIGQEVRNGVVQVELSIKLPKDSAIPLQHGMPASIEIKTEQVVPATLVLRAAGKVVRREQ